MPRPSRLVLGLAAAGAFLVSSVPVSSARAPTASLTRAPAASLAGAPVAVSARAPAASPARAPAATSARAPQLPVGTDGFGVDARVTRGRVVFAFSAQAGRIYDTIAGRRIEVGCTILVRTAGTGYAVTTAHSGQSLRAPRRPKSLRVPVGRGQFDFCTISLPAARNATPVEVVTVPVSKRGATYLDELQTARNVLGVVPLVTVSPPRHPPSEARLRKLTHGRAIGLSAKHLIPPANHVGYWTNGHGTIYVAELTYYGALFFYEEDLDTGLVVTDLLGWASGQG